ncbi:hypothetical protein SCALM49S_04014 [Streptomyces californicus]
MTTGIPPEGITVRSDTTEALGALAQKERHSYGAQFAEVAVDTATGEIRVRRMLGIFAAGRIVNPLTARNQLVGGMTWGISMALHEEAVRDRNTGGHYAPDLAGYHVATHADVPDIEADRVDDHDPDDPVGIKGVGEIGIVGAAAGVRQRGPHAAAYAATGTCPSQGGTGSSPRRGPPGVRWMLERRSQEVSRASTASWTTSCRSSTWLYNARTVTSSSAARARIVRAANPWSPAISRALAAMISRVRTGRPLRVAGRRRGVAGMTTGYGPLELHTC